MRKGKDSEDIGPIPVMFYPRAATNQKGQPSDVLTLKGGFSKKDLESINSTSKSSLLVSNDCRSLILVGKDGLLKELSINEPSVKGRLH